MKYKNLIAIITTLSTILAVNGYSEDSEALFGSWGGLKDQLEEKGITVESILTYDLLGNVSGGVKNGTGSLFNYDLTFSLDTAKAGLWDGGTAFFYGLGNWGDAFSSRVGDIQVASNIEATDSFKLYEAWYEHTLLDGAVSVLAGLHDYNSEFDSLDFAGPLLNSSFGIHVDISQVGPSIFPTTSLATRVRVQPTDDSYILAALYDGVPGDPENPKGTHVILRTDDGLFYALEMGLVSKAEESLEGYYKIALGGWYHTTDYTDYSDNLRANNGGIYLIGEKLLFTEDDKNQGLGVFGQVGFTKGDRNEVFRYFGGGINYTGLIAGRDSDIAALGVAHARHPGQFLDLNPESDSAETTIEFTYRAPLFYGITIQPDVQYIIDPGTDSTLDDALVIGTRLEVVM